MQLAGCLNRRKEKGGRREIRAEMENMCDSAHARACARVCVRARPPDNVEVAQREANNPHIKS